MLKYKDKIYDKIVIYDFETDGYWSNRGYNRPIEFGCVIISDTNIKFQNMLIKRRNNQPLRKEIVDVTGLTTEYLNKYGLRIENAFKEINEICSDDVIISGHNIINFDNKFLNFRLLKYYNRAIEFEQCFDTVPAFREVMKDLRTDKKPVKFKLDVAIEHYGLTDIWDRNVHSALIDSLYSSILTLIQLYAANIITTEQYHKFKETIVNYKPSNNFRKYNIGEKVLLNDN